MKIGADCAAFSVSSCNHDALVACVNNRFTDEFRKALGLPSLGEFEHYRQAGSLVHASHLIVACFLTGSELTQIIGANISRLVIINWKLSTGPCRNDNNSKPLQLHFYL